MKEVHNVIEEKVDNVFGYETSPFRSVTSGPPSFFFSISVISFDDACKKIDQMSLRDEDDLKTAYFECQVIWDLDPFHSSDLDLSSQLSAGCLEKHEEPASTTEGRVQ